MLYSPVDVDDIDFKIFEKNIVNYTQHMSYQSCVKDNILEERIYMGNNINDKSGTINEFLGLSYDLNTLHPTNINTWLNKLGINYGIGSVSPIDILDLTGKPYKPNMTSDGQLYYLKNYDGIITPDKNHEIYLNYNVDLIEEVFYNEFNVQYGATLGIFDMYLSGLFATLPVSFELIVDTNLGFTIKNINSTYITSANKKLFIEKMRLVYNDINKLFISFKNRCNALNIEMRLHTAVNRTGVVSELNDIKSHKTFYQTLLSIDHFRIWELVSNICGLDEEVMLVMDSELMLLNCDVYDI